MPKYVYPIYEQGQDVYLAGVAITRKKAEEYVAKKGRRFFARYRPIPILGEKRNDAISRKRRTKKD